MLDGWKTILGSVTTALGGALYAIDFAKDTPSTIAAKLLIAIGGALTVVGAAAKADKLIAATNAPDATAPNVVTPVAPPAKTDAEIIAEYRAAHPNG